MSWWAPLNPVPPTPCAMCNTTQPLDFLCGDLIKHKLILGMCKYKTKTTKVSKLEFNTGSQGLKADLRQGPYCVG